MLVVQSPLCFTPFPVGRVDNRGYCLLSGLTLRGSYFFAILVDLSSLESCPSSLGLKVGRGLLTSAKVALRGITFACPVVGWPHGSSPYLSFWVLALGCRPLPWLFLSRFCLW